MNKKLVFYPEKMTWVCVLLGIAVIARISLNAYIMFFSEQKASAYDYAMMLNGFLLPVVPFVITLIIMLMYGKEASNRKQEIDRQHYTIPNQRPKDKHCGKI